MLDINTVSAGGGTIATVDRFGVLQVGPQSAGAVPGPACYGRGGEAPTITDCNLVLGYLGEDNFPRRTDAARCRKARAAIEARWRSRSASRRRSGGRHRPRHRREDGGGDQGDLHHARP
jgi:N-methylhydantoinase A/oxoprolinase/acetone carboxylase beta subunit